ncbi:MAG: hypothetical protein H0X46_02180 [Bacteroidetes bacterium]|nr:hypothetical protein [Bacteroidota bacterium]
MEEFKKPEANPLLNPVDYFNFYGVFSAIFEGIKGCVMLSENEACLIDPRDLNTDYTDKPTFIQMDGVVKIVKNNQFDIPIESKISKFMLLTAVQFKGDTSAALTFVSYRLMKNKVPYIRVGVNYFKTINKEDRYNADHVLLKPWKKEEMKEDHGRSLLKVIYKYDDFCIIPSNTDFVPVQKNCYNLYSKFSHEPFEKDVTADDIPISIDVLKHIFGEQFELGLIYMKILYQYPKQMLPIVVLVSTERETGKTTFLNWITMIFGENSTLINPSDLTNDFNSGYASKNIIMTDETVIEKHQVVEKLKSIATAKTISVNQKHVAQYSIPFFGKIILGTNKEKDFMKIDEEEVRFWIRRLNSLKGKVNTTIESDLFNEIPKFLKFISQLPEPDFSRSRMVFTKEEIATEQLLVIKENSKTSTRKDLEILISEFFDTTGRDSFEATLSDIKTRWFLHNNQISLNWIKTVLVDQIKMEPQKMKRYSPFEEIGLPKSGTPYLFLRNKNDYPVNDQQSELMENSSFDSVDPF